MLSRADNPPPPRPGYPWRPPLLAIASLLWHLLVLGALAVNPRQWPAAFLGILANHVVLCIPGVYPHSQVFGPSWRRLPSLGRGDEVALTFDDGPDPEVTPLVLEQLKRAAPWEVQWIDSSEAIARRALSQPGGASLPTAFITSDAVLPPYSRVFAREGFAATAVLGAAD